MQFLLVVLYRDAVALHRYKLKITLGYLNCCEQDFLKIRC